MRLFNLVFGLFLFALGIVFAIQAHIGYAPWEVFHVGLSTTVGITIGTANIITGVAIGIIAVLLGEKFGIGMIFNMFLIGIFIDLIMLPNIIPISGHLGVGLAMMLLGLVLISVGSYFYIKSAFGAGPRDSLMLALNRRTKMPVGVCRGLLELTATIGGWFLGGMVGVGTVFFVIMIGLCIQMIFKLFKFEAKSVQHETICQTYQAVKRAFRKD